MIVDVHYHFIPSPMSPERINMMMGWPLHVAKIMGIEVEREILFQRAQKLWGDPDGSKLIKIMDESGIDFTIICNVDNSGIPEATVERGYRKSP